MRYQRQFRQTPEAIRAILLPSPGGKNVPLGEVADASLRTGARGRALAGTIEGVRARLAQKVRIPLGYRLKRPANIRAFATSSIGFYSFSPSAC